MKQGLDFSEAWDSLESPFLTLRSARVLPQVCKCDPLYGCACGGSVPKLSNQAGGARLLLAVHSKPPAPAREERQADFYPDPVSQPAHMGDRRDLQSLRTVRLGSRCYHRAVSPGGKVATASADSAASAPSASLPPSLRRPPPPRRSDARARQDEVGGWSNVVFIE